MARPMAMASVEPAPSDSCHACAAGSCGAECCNGDGFHDFTNLEIWMYLGLEEIVAGDGRDGVHFSPEFLPRSRDGLVIPPQQKLRVVQAEFLEVRPRLQFRRAGCQSRRERQGQEVRPRRNSRHRALLPVLFAGRPAGSGSPSTSSVSPLAIIDLVFLVVGIIIFAMSTSKPTATSVPVAPVPQVVAPVAAPVRAQACCEEAQAEARRSRASETARSPRSLQWRSQRLRM